MWKALRQIAGDSQVEAALRLLTTEERQEIEEAQAITWVRMSTSSRLVDVVAQQASLDSDKLYDDALVVAVDSTFGGYEAKQHLPNPAEGVASLRNRRAARTARCGAL